MPSDVKKHTTKKGNGAGGRPFKDISKDTFEGLCAIQCTKQEICDVLGVSSEALGNWCKRTYLRKFEEVFDQYCQNGRASLRRNQFNLAKKSATMAIWLGKQYLNQKDIPSDESEKTIAKVSEILVSIRKTASHSSQKEEKEVE